MTIKSKTVNISLSKGYKLIRKIVRLLKQLSASELEILFEYIKAQYTVE